MMAGAMGLPFMPTRSLLGSTMETDNVANGDLVRMALRAVDPRRKVVLVHASRGKRTRAEPVAALYEQGRVHHVGTLETLEDQCCTWVPGETQDSPDRLDALVWAATHTMLGTNRVMRTT